MSHVQSSGVKPPNTESTETIGKQLFRHAWEYVQRIDQATRSCRSTADLFKPELQNLRRKLREKCELILLLSCSYRRKTEELLWKKAFYEVVQRCKAHKQALDVGSPLSQAYHDHLSSGSNYYVELLQKLEVQYGVTVAGLDGSQLEDLELDSSDLQWLKASCYRCLVYLGDLAKEIVRKMLKNLVQRVSPVTRSSVDTARYKVDVGGPPYDAVVYYHYAISLDPAKGTPFNQLAALAGDKNECLDAVYYYLRSITSPHPFEGSEVNLRRMFDKNKDKLESLQSKVNYTKEPNIKDFTQKFLLVQFLHLQHLFQPGTKSVAEEDLAKLCEGVINSLEECLNYDLQLFEDTCSERARVVLVGSKGGEEQKQAVVPLDSLACLPSGLLLKFSALSILPSHSLRLQGSIHTPAATAFALSVFSQLLCHSNKRLAHLLLQVLSIQTKNPDSYAGESMFPAHREAKTESGEKLPDIENLLEGDQTMLEIMLKRPGTESLAKDFDRDTSEQSKPTKVNGATEQSKPVKDNGQYLETANTEEVNSKAKEEPERVPSKQTVSKMNQRKQRLRQIMHSRRRKRSSHKVPSSSEEEETESSGSEDEGGSASDGSTLSRSSSGASLSVLSESLGEDDLEMLESLSESGSSDEENSATQATLVPPSHPQQNASPSFTPKSEHHARPVGSKKRAVLAANFTHPSVKEGNPQSTSNSVRGNPSCPKLSADIQQLQGADTANLYSEDILLQHLLDETRFQSAVHLVCSIAAEESYLIILKVFADWLQSYPVVIATCGQSSSGIWSRLAALLNFLPTEDQLKSADLPCSNTLHPPPGLGEGRKDSGTDGWSQHTALAEDMALRGFSPLVRSQENLQFKSTCVASKLEQAAVRICCLHRFGQYVASATTVPSFTWDSITQQFRGPAQKTRAEAKVVAAGQRKDEQLAQLNRSKLMKAMAHQRLQSEVASLAEASAKKQAAIFTPYLLPDAPSLCTGLHTMKKLLKTEKFVVIIAKSVTETLDSMKKGKQNYAAREAIKFLERELQSGNKFIRAQKSHETLHPGSRKPTKMDVQTWHFTCFTDCAIYFNQVFADKGSSRAVATLLIDSHLMNLLDDPEQQADQPQLAKAIQQAQDSGVEISTMLRFYTTWKSQNSQVMKS